MAHYRDYRLEAARLRKEAETQDDREMVNTLLNVARLYERLAESVEKRENTH
jgi:hypothetical protein